MRILIFVSLLLLLSAGASGQIVFEKGYFVTNTGERIECLIRNADWGDNPTEFEYKISETEAPRAARIEEVAEFGVHNFSKFVRATVKLDRSSQNVSKLSTESTPVWSEETIFLSVLVEGSASLYAYRDKGLSLYFFKTGDEPVKQLVFRTYKTGNGMAMEDMQFRRQLAGAVRCGGTGENRLNRLQYLKRDLINYFREYNTCMGGQVTDWNTKKSYDSFYLKITPGVAFSALSVSNSLAPSRNTDFGKKVLFRMGIEAEFILPFKKQKWGVVLAPAYQSYQAGSENTYQTSIKQYVKADYRSLEFPVGIRHYFFLNEASKLFVDGFFVYDLDITSAIDFEYTEDLDGDIAINVAFGAGFVHKRIGGEVRFYTTRNTLNHYSAWHSDYNMLALIVGYKVF